MLFQNIVFYALVGCILLCCLVSVFFIFRLKNENDEIIKGIHDMNIDLERIIKDIISKK